MANATKKTAAIALAAGLALSGSAGIAAPIAGAQTTVDAGNGSTTSYSLTVQKRGGDWQDTPGYEGGAVDSVPGTELGQGFKFKIEQVTPAAGDINNASAAARVKDGVTAEGVTDSTGAVKFNNLPAGVYRVSETGVPEDSNYVTGPAFLVSVPVTKQDGTENINEVTVYPKNTKTTVEKSVVDEDKNSGDTVTYTITANAPVVPAGNTLTSFAVQDAYRADELGDVTVASVKVNGQEVDSGDYEVVDGTIQGGPADADTTKTINFVGDGLELVSQQQAAKVEVTLKAKLKPLVDGAVVNNARSIVRGPNTSSDSTPKETPWDDVTTYLGKLKLQKTNTSGAPLQGATFDLYRCSADGKLSGDAIETEVSDQDGIVNFDKSLHVTDYINDAEVPEPTKRYCAVEKKAPAGYQRLTNPVVISFTREDLTEDFTTTAGATIQQVQKTEKVINSNQPTLPSTGGMGVVLLALAGLAIVGGGVYAARRNSKVA